MKANRHITKLSQISEYSEEHAFKEISNSATSVHSKRRTKNSNVGQTSKVSIVDSENMS